MAVKTVKLRCKRCGHKWVPRIDDVKRCAKCKSTRWNDPNLKSSFVKKKIKREILETLENGALFMKEINLKLNYDYPVVRFVLMEMDGIDKTIISNLEAYKTPTKTRKGIASQKFALREQQMIRPLLKLDKCDSCGGFGVATDIVDDFYWAKKCSLCGFVKDKKFSQALKDESEKWSKVTKVIRKEFEKVLKNIRRS